MFAAVVLGARSATEIATRVGAPPQEVLGALLALQTAHLARREEDGWHPVPSTLQLAAAGVSGSAAASGAAAEKAQLDLTREQAAVFRAFMAEGRITALPAQRSKRLVLLDHVARALEVGVRYPEREVDAVMRAFFDDHAMLRRSLVDEGYLSRDHGVYWRSGGSVL